MGMFDSILAGLGSRGLMPQGVLSTIDNPPAQAQPSDAYQTPDPSMMMGQAPQPPQGGALSGFIGAGASDDFNRALLAAGSGLLSRPGAQGLGQAAANVGQFMDERQKRLDDSQLKQAKIAKLQADVARGQMPKVTSMGNGMVLITPADGSPAYTMTDDEFRSAKLGQMNAQTDLTNKKAQQIQYTLDNPDNVKSVQKVGDTFLIIKKDGSKEVYTNEELQAAYGRDADAKLARLIEATKFRQENAPLTAAEQKISDEHRSDLLAADKNIAAVDNAMSVASSIEPGIVAQLAGSDIGGAIASLASGNSKTASDVRRYQQAIQAVLVSDWLEQGLKLKGAQSDKEGAALKARQPKPTDDYETIIKPWLQDVQKWMAQAKKVAEDNIARERKPGAANPVAPPAPESTGSTGDAKPVNNPGNLRVPGSTTGFQQFPSLDAGVAGTKNQLMKYGDRGLNTVSKIISTWSPPNENDTPALIKKASAFLGVSPDQPLDMKNPAVIDALSMAIFAQEGNLKKVQAAQKPAAKPAAPMTPAPAATTTEDNDPLGIRKKK